MEFDLWLGSETSYTALQDILAQFKGAHFNKEAFFPSPFDREKPENDPVFGVDTQRVGLSVLRKVGETTVIRVAGSLTPNYSRWHSWMPGEATSYEAIRDALAICEESGNTDVVMHFDTQGGSVRGLSQTTDAMKRFKRAGGKLRGHSDSLAASAGYWMLSSCDQVSASEMAEIGSIGTMAVIRTMVNTEENMGVKFTVIKAGKYKALGNPFEDITPEIKARLQQNIDETNQFFLNHVSIERNLMLSETGAWAEGQVFFAKKAMQVGLIDKVITMDDLIGSGPAAKNPSDTRRFEMEISAEKLAQIQAGADPKSVLSADELKIYMQSLDTANQEDDTPPAEPEPEAKEPAKEPVQPAAPPVSMSEELTKALRENGRLEAKMEGIEAELVRLKEANEGLSKGMESLLVVAQAAVGNLQRALGKPLETKATVTDVLAQYNDLQSTMAKVFPTQQQSKAAPVKDTTKNGGAPLDYRMRAPQPTKGR